MCVEDAIDADCVGCREKAFAAICVRTVEVHGYVKGVADPDVTVGGVGVSDHGQGVEVGVVWEFAHRINFVRETGGFYVGEFDPVGFVGEGFDVECVPKLSLVWARLSSLFYFAFCIKRGRLKGDEPCFPGVWGVASFWGTRGYVEEFNWGFESCHFVWVVSLCGVTGFEEACHAEMGC